MGGGGVIKPKEIGTVILDLENTTVKLHNLTFEQVYYLPGSPKILFILQKCSWDSGECEVIREGTYLKVMGKRAFLVCDNDKSPRSILHVSGCALP